MNNSNTQTYAPNFCPNCGCNIVSIAVAMQFAALRANGGNGGNGATNGKREAPLSVPALPVQTLGAADRRVKPWTSEEYQRCLKLRASGKTVVEIAETLGRSNSAIQNALYSKKRAGWRNVEDSNAEDSNAEDRNGKDRNVVRKTGSEYAGHGAPVTVEECRRAMKLRKEEGLSGAKIALVLGCKKERVYHLFEKAKTLLPEEEYIDGVKLVTPEEVARVVELRKSGMTNGEVGSEMGIGIRRVRRAIAISNHKTNR